MDDLSDSEKAERYDALVLLFRATRGALSGVAHILVHQVDNITGAPPAVQANLRAALAKTEIAIDRTGGPDALPVGFDPRDI